MSSTGTPTADWREGRRRSARNAILDAAWAAVREEGLAGLSMRHLATRAGVTTPTLYAYFDSKMAIYDGMFGQAAAEFTRHMTEPFDTDVFEEMLLERTERFIDFCTADVARYQLLFQRTIPGFEPSPESYRYAVEALEVSRQMMAGGGITDPRHHDMWTALVTGLVDQQISNDPGGDRWSRLASQFVEMFLAYCRSSAPKTARKGKKL
jgi:AcrR family transcriptional regulator